MRRYTTTLIVLAALCTALVLAQAPQIAAQSGSGAITGLRGSAPLGENAEAPRIPQTEETNRRRPRNYPEQPPTIPHKIDGYVIDMNSNKCLSCHARSRVQESGAPMVSITHFMDRDGQFLATVSPRRYFCDQCHIPQMEVTEPIENTFVDIDSLLSGNSGKAPN